MAAARTDLSGTPGRAGGAGPVLGLLHTAEEHRGTFAALVSHLAPGLHDLHVVEPGLLAQARAEGLDAVRDELLTHLRALAGAGADHVLVTCSTLGGAAEALREQAGVPVLRVDRPMALEAVRVAAGSQRPVLVVAALESTLGPTEDLLREVSPAPLVVVHEVTDAWPLLQTGDREAYLAATAAATRRAVARHDPVVVVLAQASAAGAAALLGDLPCPVLSSPAGAVRHLARVTGSGTDR